MSIMDFSRLLSQIDSVTAKKKTYDDGTENYWRPTKDKAGNAAAVIRFLPNKDVSDIPFVRLYTHSFKDPSTNRWYIENSLSTIGKQDYIGTTNSELWNSGLDSDKELARARKRKLNYICNILVVKDLGNPENDGKVFLFKFGRKIFDKIIEAAKPDESLGEEAVNVFDPTEGADFSLKQTVVANFPNYDQSKFGSKKAIAGGAKRIDEVLSKCFDLNLEVALDKFKSEADLEKKFLWVTGAEDSNKAKKAAAENYDAELDELTKIAAEPTPAPKAKKVAPPMPVEDASPDDDEKFFASLLTD